jgi:hypothetical protein
MPGAVSAPDRPPRRRALAEIICASARTQAVFDRFQAPATRDGEHAERALAVPAANMRGDGIPN